MQYLLQYSIYSNEYGLQIRNILTGDAANESITSSLAYSNLAVFVGVLFCFSGLSPNASIYYVSTAFMVFAATAVTGIRLSQSSQHNNSTFVMISAAAVANELALSSILIFDYFSVDGSNTFYGVGILVGISFISVQISARLTISMVISKTVTIVGCVIYILTKPSSGVPPAEVAAVLVIALLVMLATGYWINLSRQKEILLQLQLHDMHRNSDQQNKQLKTLLIEKETTRKKLELEYMLRQKLVSHVGHDLRQPITAASYMLRQIQKTAPPEIDRTLISDTSECISSASRMIEDIVQYTHFNNYEIDVIPTQSSLHDILMQIAREYSTQAENASCQIRCSYTSLMIKIDTDLLKRVLRNLVTNVIKHSDASQTLLGVRRKKAGIEIWVVDNGRGIDDKTVDSDFLISTQSKDGLGLGLSISRQLVEACGGRLKISSKNGEGTIVKIAIPNHMVFSQSKFSHSTIRPSTTSV